MYSLDRSKESTAEHPLAPYSEHARLGLWLSGAARQANWLRAREEYTFYDLKAAVDNILRRAGIDSYTASVAECPANTIFCQALELKSPKGVVLGKLGVVAHDICRKLDVKADVFYAELDWNVITRIAARTNALYSPLPKAQPVKRDLSLLIDSKVTMADVEAAVRQAEKKILTGIELFDVYEGEKLPEGKKSYAVSITLHDPEKTLQDKYIDKVMSKIIDSLRRNLDAELR